MNLEERVKNLVISQLGVDAGKVTKDSSFIDDLGADSLDTVELVMAFEEEFDMEISDDEAQRLKTVGDVITYLTSKGIE
ncbi:acyl carrier protein [bacterium]|nr:acyl carrier protein [bacterium]